MDQDEALTAIEDIQRVLSLAKATLETSLINSQRADNAKERIHSLTMQLQDELIYHQQAQREISDLRKELARWTHPGKSSK